MCLKEEVMNSLDRLSVPFGPAAAADKRPLGPCQGNNNKVVGFEDTLIHETRFPLCVQRW